MSACAELYSLTLQGFCARSLYRLDRSCERRACFRLGLNTLYPVPIVQLSTNPPSSHESPRVSTWSRNQTQEHEITLKNALLLILTTFPNTWWTKIPQTTINTRLVAYYTLHRYHTCLPQARAGALLDYEYHSGCLSIYKDRSVSILKRKRQLYFRPECYTVEPAVVLQPIQKTLPWTACYKQRCLECRLCSTPRLAHTATATRTRPGVFAACIHRPRVKERGTRGAHRLKFCEIDYRNTPCKRGGNNNNEWQADTAFADHNFEAKAYPPTQFQKNYPRLSTPIATGSEQITATRFIRNTTGLIQQKQNGVSEVSCRLFLRGY